MKSNAGRYNCERPGGVEPASDVQRKIIEALRRPDAYSERPARVEVIETHISWVFLTDRHAYKLKKPVRFNFLDYGTREARRRACQRELELNRRLAPHVYLDLIPVGLDRRGEVRLDAGGPPVEWLVRMRRLPAEWMLDELIRGGNLRAEDLQRLAARLARFYCDAPPLALRPQDYRRRVEQHVRANREELLGPAHGLPADLVRRVHAAQLRLLALAPAAFHLRVCDGRIVDGHGDLRPEHICLEAPPVVFDCVEFNDELRQVDVVDELSFLDVGCRQLGAAEVGTTILGTYLRASGDRPPQVLLDFYASYRACVRAKVAVLRAAQHGGQAEERDRDEALRYLELAGGAARCLARPAVLVIRGLMGTGKSSLARMLAQHLGIESIATDAVRRELYGRSPVPSGFGEGHYAPARAEEVYRDLFQQAEKKLAQGESVILDGSFLLAAHRLRVAELAGQHGAPMLMIRCHCPADVARERIDMRLQSGKDASEARPDLMAEQARREEADPAGLATLVIDTTIAQAEQQELVMRGLAEVLGMEDTLAEPPAALTHQSA